MNKELLVNETLQPDFPSNISVETGRHWPHELGLLASKKGCYVNGHEHANVVEDTSRLFLGQRLDITLPGNWRRSNISWLWTQG